MPELILPLIRQGTTTLPVDGSITLPKHFDRVEIDATSGNIIITLPLITHVFRKKPAILFKRIDLSTNTVTIIGTSGNYDRESLLIGDPKVSTTKIYAGDDNIWRTGEIEDIFASNQKTINFKSDFGTASGGEIQLQSSTHYLLNSPIDLGTDHLILPTGSVKISSVTADATLTYTGTNATITGSDFGFCLLMDPTIISPNGAHFDLDNGGNIIMTRVNLGPCTRMGELSCANVIMEFPNSFQQGDGLIFDDRTDGVRRGVVGIRDAVFGFGQNNTTTLMDFKGGKISGILINGRGAIPTSNETIFNFRTALKDEGATITLRGFDLTFPFTGAAIFAPGSLDHSYINSVFNSNIGIQSSTSLVELGFAGNSAVTTISTQDTPTPINSNVLYTINTLDIERFLIQDECTFDNATNTINTAFNHGMAANNRVFLNAYPGSSLPAELDETTEYFIVNVNAADFQLSLTSGGPVVTFTDNGSGTLHYRHTTGVTQLAHTIYIGNETIKCRSGGWVSLISTTGIKIDVSATSMKIAIDGTITTLRDGGPDGVTSSEAGISPLSSVSTLSTSEGNVVYIENETNGSNFIAVKLETNLNQIT